MPEEVKGLVNDFNELSEATGKLIDRLNRASPGFDSMAAAQRKATEATLNYNKKLQELEQAQKKGGKALEDYEKELSQAERTMKQSVKQLQDYKKAQAQVDAQLKKSASFVSEMRDAHNKAAKAIFDYNKKLKGLGQAKKQGRDALKRYKKELSNAKAEMKKSIAAYGDYKKASKDLSNAISKNSSGLKKYSSAIKSGVGALKGFGSGVMGVVGVLGVGAVSFKAIYDAAREYNQGLIELSATLAVAGRSLDNWDAVMEGVRNETSMSQVTFMKFAGALNKGLVGRPRDLEEYKDVFEDLRRQVGYSEEAMSEWTNRLLQIQNIAPQVYGDLEKALAIRRQVDMGTASEDEIKFLKTMEDGIQVRLERIGLTEQEARATASMLAERGPGFRKALDQERSLVEAQEKFRDAMTELSKVALPILTKLASGLTELMKLMGDMPGTVGKVGAAFVGLKVFGPIMTKGAGALIKFSKSAKGASTIIGNLNMGATGATGAITKLGQAGLVAGAAIAGWQLGKKLDELLGISDAIGEIAGKMTQAKLLKEEEEDVKKRLEEMKRTYKEKGEEIDKIWAEITQGRKGNYAQTVTLENILKGEQELKQYVENRKKLQESATKAMKDESKATDTTKEATSVLHQEYKALSKTIETNLMLLDQTISPLEKQIGMAEEFGMVNRQAMDQMISRMQTASSEADKLLQKAIERAASGANIEFQFDIQGDPVQQARELQKVLYDRLQTLKEAGGAEEEIKNVEDSLKIIQEDLVQAAERRHAVIKGIFETEKAYMKQQEQFSSKYESRLEAQRRLMESAQFGLGASVEMMQKQVDLAHELMQGYQETDRALSNRLVSETNITKEQIEAVRGAKSQRDAQKMVAQFTELTGDEQKALIGYAAEHQEITTKTMQQQQKIYDLTKEVREGYLDAIREMSVGAGEFSKIIGTQEMGVTQLMGLVGDVTGEAKLNTMALGGLQEQALTAEGLGTEAAYKYTTGGLAKGISGQQEKQRLGRIWNYAESREKAERGQVEAGVGTGVAAGERDIDAIKEGAVDGTYEGAKQGVIEGLEAAGGRPWSHGMLAPGGQRGGTLPGQQRRPAGHVPGVAAGQLGAGLMGGSRGQVADPTGGPTLARQVIGIDVDRLTQKQASNIQKTLSEQQQVLEKQLADTKEGSESYKDINNELKQVKEAQSKIRDAAQTQGRAATEAAQSVQMAGGTMHYDVRTKAETDPAKMTAQQRKKVEYNKMRNLAGQLGVTGAQLKATGYTDPVEAMKYLTGAEGSGRDMLSAGQRGLLEDMESGVFDEAHRMRQAVGKVKVRRERVQTAKTGAPAISGFAGPRRVGGGASRRKIRRMGTTGAIAQRKVPVAFRDVETEEQAIRRGITRQGLAGERAFDFAAMSNEDMQKKIAARERAATMGLDEAKGRYADVKTVETERRKSKEQEKVASAEAQAQFTEAKKQQEAMGMGDTGIGAEGGQAGGAAGGDLEGLLTEVSEKLDIINGTLNSGVRIMAS